MNKFQKYACKYAKQCLGRNNAVNEPYSSFKRNMNGMYAIWKESNYSEKRIKDFLKWHKDFKY